MSDPTVLANENPLLDFSGLPRFASITPGIIKPAIDALIANAKLTLAQLATSSETPSWQNLVTPLDDVIERLSRAWGQVGQLNGVANSPALREVYNGLLPAVTEFFTTVSQDERLFAKYQQIRASSGFTALNAAQRKAIDNELRDFRLGGAELPADKKARFKQVQEELSMLSSTFSDNVLDATNAFALYVEDEAELSGLPGDVKQAAREAAEKDGKPGWKLTLRAPCYLPVMQYAQSQALREKMYYAYFIRASEFGDPKLDNTAVIKRILELRNESAALLGYKNYAEVSLATKMAEHPAEVISFLDELATKSRPFAEKDMHDVKEFARSQFSMNNVNAWDIPFISEKLRQQRYAFSDDEVKQYFPESIVLPGMFRVVETIYGVVISEAKTETWNPAVRFFNVHDSNQELIGQFYLDLYARESKRGGAWMDDAINRRRKHGVLQHPVAYLTCNFSAPVGNKPALFTHDQVITLFHEFGHGLHMLLTQVDELSVSGINGVEWDAVELPSQFMENFCWEWEVLQHMTQHVDTGATLPRALFDKMIAAKNFQSGAFFVRQLEFGLFDMHLHADFDVKQGLISDLIERIRARVAVIQYPPFVRHQNQFSHIFGGGYAAGYYSYKWAEVLSADAYSAFEENGVLSRETGSRFRREVLAVGGSRPAMDSFVAFRGRKPSIDALLRHNGMSLKQAA